MMETEAAGLSGESGVYMRTNIYKDAVISTANSGDCEVETKCAWQYYC